ncbi:ABC transporter ATP-binding protein [Futiania mangrovi]|uniref:ABC transporter ATP-binding protein n=1 Tax=Futiania mangrovi TaxID=2959716 RepID=A0A9J6PE14_9PROT|nr:ABC transporter ATP-binding protein [Futiania mangrovii]MCP1335979.1 ABC transporter ATP-binding protein [Futiania mangrovii]
MSHPLDHGLSLRAVTRRFGGVTAADEVSINVGAGEVVCLLGPSGCGKTTTLRIAAGLERPDAGEVYIDGRLVAGRGLFVPPEDRGVGLMFQDFALFPHLDVTGNVTFGLTRMSGRERAARAAEVLDLVGLSHLAKAWPHTLSGGEQQRVALARALAPRPGVILMDEPFSGLDRRLRDQVRDQTIAILKAADAATLFVTHEPEEALRVADRIVLMRAGQVVQAGTPLEIYEDPVDRDAAYFFSDLNEFEVRVTGGMAMTPAGPVPAGEMADGARVRVCVRPEAVLIDTDESGDGIAAEVTAARFMGHETLTELALPGNAVRVQALVPGRAPVDIGGRARVRIDPEGAFVFASAQGSD